MPSDRVVMAREEWDRIRELEDRVTIDDALLGTLRERIRELEAENERHLLHVGDLKAVRVQDQAEIERLRKDLTWIWDYAYGASGETGDDAGHLTALGMRAKDSLEFALATDEEEANRAD